MSGFQHSCATRRRAMNPEMETAHVPGPLIRTFEQTGVVSRRRIDPIVFHGEIRFVPKRCRILAHADRSTPCLTSSPCPRVRTHRVLTLRADRPRDAFERFSIKVKKSVPTHEESSVRPYHATLSTHNHHNCQ